MKNVDHYILSHEINSGKENQGVAKMQDPIDIGGIQKYEIFL